MSKAQIRGEDRRRNPDLEGKPKTSPDGWTMVLRAMVTRPQKADCHDTSFDIVIELFREIPGVTKMVSIPEVITSF